jgi:hypothetical protein
MAVTEYTVNGRTDMFTLHHNQRLILKKSLDTTFRPHLVKLFQALFSYSRSQGEKISVKKRRPSKTRREC